MCQVQVKLEIKVEVWVQIKVLVQHNFMLVDVWSDRLKLLLNSTQVEIVVETRIELGKITGLSNKA